MAAPAKQFTAAELAAIAASDPLLERARANLAEFPDHPLGPPAEEWPDYRGPWTYSAGYGFHRREVS